MLVVNRLIDKDDLSPPLLGLEASDKAANLDFFFLSWVAPVLNSDLQLFFNPDLDRLGARRSVGRRALTARPTGVTW